jgi:hypothetical protein
VIRFAAACRAGLAGLLAAGLTGVAAAVPAEHRMDVETDRTGPPGGERALAGVGTAAETELGRRIYRDGVGANGKPILGLRFGGVEAQGAKVACVGCHRRSGLGAVEGTDLVAPIAGRFVLEDEPRAVVSMNFRTNKSFNQRHAPFDDASFAAAVTQGRHVDGRDLSPIMPRFDLTAPELRALQSYLRTLSAQWSPGVSARRLRFATVVTPEVSPQRRAAFLQTVQAAVGQKNGNFMPGMRTMSSAAEMMFRTDRHWDLEVWELQGAPETWAAQLDSRQAADPVFALVSGLGDGRWEPVHDFCERQQVPCWFPVVQAPPVRPSPGFYSLYFSAGVSLEADVLARHLDEVEQRPRRVVQVVAGDAAGSVGAERLSASLAKLLRRIPVETRSVQLDRPASIKAAWAGLGPRDVVMLWWPAGAWSVLDGQGPPAARVFASTQLSQADPAELSPAWRTTLRWVYPYQLPEQRQAGLFYFKSWLQVRKLALQDELLQSQVYFAMSYLGETLVDMLDNVHADYLVERAESMLSQNDGAKAEDQSRELTVVRHNKGGAGGTQGAMVRLAMPEARKSPRPMPGRADHVMMKREGTTVYPRLSLAPGQRFASKGAYIVRLARAQGADLVAESDWIVP